jgi:hypothetical protein
MICIDTRVVGEILAIVMARELKPLIGFLIGSKERLLVEQWVLQLPGLDAGVNKC